MLLRSASICSKWRQQGEVLLLARSLSGSPSPANEDLNLTELAQHPKSSAFNTDTRFGISPRKVRDEEDEDFVPPASPTTTIAPADSSNPPNYFSRTWAMQKSIITGESILTEEEVPPLSKDAHSPQFIPSSRSVLKRTWQVASNLDDVIPNETFRFASLKVLSTEICKKHRGQLYSFVPFDVLGWSYRRRKLLDDLDQISADIICLQELDTFKDLRSELSQRGYLGLYKVSTRAPGRCAIFWKEKRFKLLHEESVDFASLGFRSNVAQLCVFQSTVPGTADEEVSTSLGSRDHNRRNCLLVGNIDPLFNPRRGEIKIAQCRTFLQETHRVSNKWPGTPIIIGGCFHATPESAIYKFLAESKVDLFGLESALLSGHFVKKEVSSESPARTPGTKKVEINVDLYQRLRHSILAKTASKQDTHAVKFVNTASLSSYHSPVNEDRAAARAFVAETVGFLESSVESQKASSGVDYKSGRVDASGGSTDTSERKTESNSNSLVSKLVEPNERTPEPVSSAGVTLKLDPPGAEAAKKDRILDPAKEARGSSGSPTIAAHGWDPEVLKTISGSDNCTVVKHGLKLFSVYPEVQGEAATRDSKGEPSITMLHNEFKGTVDYIWRSEGLKTMKVLDTFRKDEMLVAPLIPFMVSGSDHVSLACELGFSKSIVQS
ncbi:hypothetical protein L7F22_022181 [Adiantum nelumboides]|nr:hypothetical protein [Adiantum nelumboides]